MHTIEASPNSGYFRINGDDYPEKTLSIKYNGLSGDKKRFTIYVAETKQEIIDSAEPTDVTGISDFDELLALLNTLSVFKTALGGSSAGQLTDEEVLDIVDTRFINSGNSVGTEDSFGGGVDRKFMGANLNYRHYTGNGFTGTATNLFRIATSQINSYVPLVLQSYNNSQRDGLSGLSDGAMIYNSQINEFNYLDNETWFRIKRISEIIPFNTSRNITESDIQNCLYSTTSATLTITASFDNMEVGHEIELLANGTTITVTATSGATVNGVSAGSVTHGNDSNVIGGTIKKVGANDYLVF